MTYEESYRKCKTLDELRSEVIEDLTIAKMINDDRIPVIKKAAEKVANEKFKKTYFIKEE